MEVGLEIVLGYCAYSSEAENRRRLFSSMSKAQALLKSIKLLLCPILSVVAQELSNCINISDRQAIDSERSGSIVLMTTMKMPCKD
jgi:hypothetical protein